jgi:hypothetical protein
MKYNAMQSNAIQKIDLFQYKINQYIPPHIAHITHIPLQNEHSTRILL